MFGSFCIQVRKFHVPLSTFRIPSLSNINALMKRSHLGNMAQKITQHSYQYKGILWQVTFLLFSWLCHSVSAQLHYSIPEEMRKGSVIANIAVDLGLDIKQLSSRRFYIVTHNSEKYFSVDLENGNLFVTDRIDRETLCGAAVTCFLTFDAVVANPLNVFTVIIEIQDINDNSPSFCHEIINLEMIELSFQGTRFALQNAKDPDIGINSVQTYKLSDNQHFTLSEKTSTDGSTFPELVLEKPLDRETKNIHELILTAMDGGNPIRTGTALLRIIIADVNDNFPMFSQDIYKVSISENTPINSSVICVNATDQDEGINANITYTFDQTPGTNIQAVIFSIHPTKGDIKTKKVLDFETTKNYEISVQAKDGGGLVAHAKVLIEILDENDNAPEISITLLSSPIPEDSAPGTLIALIKVHDYDSEKNGEVDCQILEKVPFDLLPSSKNYYKIVTAMAMDRETNAFYIITIIATDKGFPPLSTTKTIRLDISDINDNPPVFMKSRYIAYVSENNLLGTSIYRIQASDLDSGQNAKITYSMSSTNKNAWVSSYLSINTESGVLYAQKSFDYEQYKEFHMQVTAKDSGSPSLSSNTTLIVYIVDLNDNIPNILYPARETDDSALFEMVPLASKEGSLITKVVAVDADSGHNAWLSYHFTQISEPSYFSISQHTGEIRTSRAFQEMNMLKQTVVVLVKDNGVPSLSATVTLSFLVGDNFLELVPKLNNQFSNEESKSNIQMYLVIALVIISLFFVATIMLTVISKCKDTKHPPDFGSFNTNFYSPVDPRVLSQFSDGTLRFPYSYNVCVALDSSDSEFTFPKQSQNVPMDNLIDAEDSLLEDKGLEKSLATNNLIQNAVLLGWCLADGAIILLT